MTALSHGVLGIAAERRRQIEEKGWSFAHDDDHRHGELLLAAECYIAAAFVTERTGTAMFGPMNKWPFDDEAWQPSTDPLRNLAKAGALIAAEMDRIRRHRVESSQNLSEVDG